MSRQNLFGRSAGLKRLTCKFQICLCRPAVHDMRLYVQHVHILPHDASYYRAADGNLYIGIMMYYINHLNLVLPGSDTKISD